MFKRVLLIPNILGQDSVTRKQMLNILLIGLTFILIQGLLVLLLNYKNVEDWYSHSFILITILNAVIVFLIIVFISLSGINIANRTIRDAQRNTATSDAILNNIADGVLILNLQGDFVSANPALLRMIPEIDIKQVILKPLPKTIRWKHKFFSVSVSELPEIGTLAVFHDETSRHEIERAHNDLLTTASHELRTPLTAVMNYLEFIQVLIHMGKINTVEFNEHVARALENVKRLQSLVNDILDQAQIQAGAMNLKHQTFNLHSTFEKAHQLLEILIKEKRLSYELLIESNVPVEITGDPNRLHQILVNLLGNAIKFTNEGGIKVYVSMVAKEKISIQVIDSGPGIPTEQLPYIFQAFKRGSDNIHHEQQGAGLGLSIVKELVTRMGWEISVFSEPGNGSTFIILLPLNAV